MKNLFQYATKELSQDAFLMWLFENHDCENENVRKTAYKLLNTFCKLNMKLDDIVDLKCYKQYKDIDVIVRFEYCGNIYLVVIEDKTFSGQHDNQLAKYNAILDEKDTLEWMAIDKKENINRVFYKTDINNADDIKACRDEEWTYYFIDDIIKLFNGIENTENEILDDYVEHLKWVHDNVTNVSNKPIENWDKINYRTFFYKLIMPFTDNLPESKWIIKLGGWHSYSSLILDRIIMYNDKRYILGMEIRSKTEGLGVIIRLIEKDNNDKDVEVDKQIKSEFRSIITNSKSFNSRNNKWCVANSSKLLDKKLSSKNNIDVMTQNLKELIEEYISICKDCESIDKD